ncbi:unnamed protein product [Macrosiphum euphorbiae]|uniref:Uncharacterized protein n=1 Tax=Macrosiphum euphorbiae TaxID=13131 RepID=A0AAV0XKU4_9HEMI|nr:unnamed protein product [Macrosiphum euphorbiae]
MFLSYATVPMFVFTIMLNFFFLNSPIKSTEVGMLFEKCSDCLADSCHKDKHRPCMKMRSGSFLCFRCEIEFGDDQYYTFDECKTGCTNSNKTCACESMCYVCISKAWLEEGGTLQPCYFPTEEERNITCK